MIPFSEKTVETSLTARKKEKERRSSLPWVKKIGTNRTVRIGKDGLGEAEEECRKKDESW